MDKLIFNAPINPLSIGQVSYNILKELKNLGIDVIYFPIGQPDLTAYDSEPEFAAWLQNSANNRFKTFDRSIPSLKVWHINGSESKLSDNQFLYTFYECDSPTLDELNIVKQQKKVIFSSNYAKGSFETYGAKNCGFAPVGFDETFLPVSRRIMPQDTMHWILVGKWEFRKNTELIIKTWIKKYGNNINHQLSLCVVNPFFRPEQNNQLFNNTFGGPKPFNVNIINPLKKNKEILQLHNSADIDLSGFSNSEGWGLPAFNSTCLGKWAVVTNCSAHRDWADESNTVLVEPNAKKPCYDGAFFVQGASFNQGNFFDFNEEQLIDAMKRAELKFKVVNHEGEKLKEKFTYKSTVEKLLSEINL